MKSQNIIQNKEVQLPLTFLFCYRHRLRLKERGGLSEVEDLLVYLDELAKENPNGLIKVGVRPVRFALFSPDQKRLPGKSGPPIPITHTQNLIEIG